MNSNRCNTNSEKQRQETRIKHISVIDPKPGCSRERRMHPDWHSAYVRSWWLVGQGSIGHPSSLDITWLKRYSSGRSPSGRDIDVTSQPLSIKLDDLDRRVPGNYCAFAPTDQK